jgi:uncharacterized protein (DUF2062 family)
MPDSDPSASAPGASRRPFWRRWLVDPVVQQLKQGVSPEKIALALAVGSATALFPILGTTTVLCAAVSICLRLNQAIVQGINALCMIIWIPCLIGQVRVGDALTGVPTQGLNVPAMIGLFRRQPAEFFHRFGTTALHAVLGWLVLAPLWTLGCYFVCRRPLRAFSDRLRPNKN